METFREREIRYREQQWATQELREALINLGWFPPHSFKLRNPEKKGRYKHIKSFHFRAGRPNLPAHIERALSRQERLRIFRECGYQMTYDDPVPGDYGSSSWADFQIQLQRAVILGYTQLESVGKTFFDIGFLLGRAVRPLEPMLSNQEHRDLLLLHDHVLYPYHDIMPLQPEPMPSFWIPEGGGWVMECQDSFRHLKLIHFANSDHGSEMVCEIQWEDDPYLVNIAEEYLLLLLFRAQLPLARQYLLARHHIELFEQLIAWGPEHLSPIGTRYACPAWMERILNYGYY